MSRPDEHAPPYSIQNELRVARWFLACVVPGINERKTRVAGKCDVCGKTKTFGHNVSFSKRRTNRSFKPNVHKKRLVLDGVAVRVNVCTRCVRTMSKSA